MSLQHLPPTTTGDAVAAALGEDGAVIVDDLADDDLLRRIADEVQPYIDRTPTGFDDFGGIHTTRTGALIARSPACRELVLHPLALDATRALLTGSTTFHLHLTQVIAIGPGQPAQYIHRDQWAFDHFEFPKGYEVQCNTIWALDDFTEANGCTRVVPGSHLWDDHLKLDQTQTVGAEMRRGSVIFYTGAVYHGGGANTTTDVVRRGINITYARSWLRQEENQYLSCPPEVARTLPRKLLRLMGYARGAYALGYIDDARDPIEAILPGEGSTGFTPGA